MNTLATKSSRLLSLFAVLFVVAAGMYLAISIRANTAVVATEPEKGAITAPAAALTDSSASGGSGIRFGLAGTAPICSSKKLVILGSSTAAGVGASPISNSWVNRYTTHLKSSNPAHAVANLAVSGYNTYKVLPTGTTPPANRPSPDTARNITAAVSQKPHAIIVNLPSNDTSAGYSVNEVKTNYATIKSVADQAGIPIWFSTTQPRNLSQTGRDQLRTLKDWTLTTYGDRALDYWTSIASSDGTIKSTYSAGDGVHLNNAGHQKLYEEAHRSNVLTTMCGRL